MSGVALHHILDRRFRANPAFQLVLFDRLDPSQQETLKDLTKDPDFYGVLVRSGTGASTTKSVCRDTALLLLTLREPGPLPTYTRNLLGEECNREIAELVLDGVLQIDNDGQFLSGPEAYSLIYPESARAEVSGVIQRLSRAAIQYGQALDVEDTVKLSARLYFYNRLPLTLEWKRRFPTRETVASYLGIEDGGTNARFLERRWTRRKHSSLDGWFQWECRGENTIGNASGQLFKLYVSPRPEWIAETFGRIAGLLPHSRAHHFKAGDDAAGLLRPDKFVLYFWNQDALFETAHQLLEGLGGIAAQGVPFTAAIGDTGLVSWGVDPVAGKGLLAWQERESWRLWITNRLAAALVAARQNSLEHRVEPWRFALERLRLEHIDTDSWTPLVEFGRAA